MSLAVMTAAALAVVLVVALLVVLVFLFQIRRFVGQAADAMERAGTGTAQFAGHLSGLQRNTSAAAGELPADRT
jgi:uncharacterized membrane protein YqiK